MYDPSRPNEPFGLLEIKCPADVSSVLEIKDNSLKRDRETGALQLNPNHKYHHQIQMQLAVTGLPWCDYYVWTENPQDYYLETIRLKRKIGKLLKTRPTSFILTYSFNLHIRAFDF